MTGECQELSVPSRYEPWLNFFPFRWCDTSMASLIEAERNMLKHIWNILECSMVTIANGSREIRTVSMNTQSDKTPLVLLHGMGAGVGFWCLNLQSFSAYRPVYAIDLLGFGRSSRIKFPSDPMLCEIEFIESIEEWRKKMKLDSFILLGHSLGGFLAAAYALRYPQHLNHLILVDPWGFPPAPATNEPSRLPWWVKTIAAIVKPFNPFASLRAAGPLGQKLIQRFRSDLLMKFSSVHDEDTVLQYMYHCNVQTPSGEGAFKSMAHRFGYAVHPMLSRITEIDKNISITALYGSRSWISSDSGYEMKYKRTDSHVDVQIVKGCGHHVYADAAASFNDHVNKACQRVDLSKYEMMSEID